MVGAMENNPSNICIVEFAIAVTELVQFEWGNSGVYFRSVVGSIAAGKNELACCLFCRDCEVK